MTGSVKCWPPHCNSLDCGSLCNKTVDGLVSSNQECDFLLEKWRWWRSVARPSTAVRRCKRSNDPSIDM